MEKIVRTKASTNEKHYESDIGKVTVKQSANFPFAKKKV